MAVAVSEWGLQGACKFDGHVGALVVIALHAFRSARPQLAELVRGCVSGQELIARGYPEDVEIAIELNASDAAPLLVAGAYVG